jgi:2'-hydroxyisoflavone reductase
VRILVLGGTSFVGRAIVEDALRTGPEVTLFGRGKTGTDLFGDLTRLIGDPRQPVQIVDSRDLARLVVQLLTDDRPGAFHAVGPATPVTLGELVQTCARVAGTEVDIVPVPLELAPPFFPLVRTDWATQQRSPARARAAGMPATALEVTAADVLAWDRRRGEPPLDGGFTPEQEQAVLATR